MNATKQPTPFSLQPSALSLLTGRRSIRRYRPDPVPAEMIEKMLAAACWAPSAHNRQPWRFVVMSEAKTKQQLATAMGSRLRQDLTADQVPEAIIAQDVGRSYQRITQAPLLILLCLTMADMDSYPDSKRQQNEWIMATQSTAMAGQNLLLAAHALGLGACWMCAPLFCPDVVARALDLPADWQPQALITAGYPAVSKTKARQPLASRLLYR
jgi:coenzyme F420-0:L-glutamate ligase / coenzyme F420-1:gamma-L-glutamate ligase